MPLLPLDESLSYEIGGFTAYQQLELNIVDVTDWILTIFFIWELG